MAAVREAEPNQVALPTWTAAQATYAAARRSPALVGAYLWPLQGNFATMEADFAQRWPTRHSCGAPGP